MDAEEELNRLRTVYMDRLKRRNSLAAASRRLGVNEGFLANQKNHKRGIRSGDALRSLRVLGCALPEELYHEVFFSEDTDPARILAYSREFQELKPDPFMVGLLARLETLAAGPVPESEWTNREGEILDLDRLRRRDRQAARKQLEVLILEILESGSLPKLALADLSRALGVLAAIYRLAGRRDDAVDLLVAIRPLAVRTCDLRVEAEWFQKAAFLLVDLNRGARAEEFLRQAHVLFDLAGAGNERLRTLVDHGYVLAKRSKFQEALEKLSSVISRLPAVDVEGRIAAHQSMSLSFEKLGNLAAARFHLDEAINLVNDDLMAKAYCLSRRADLLVASGDLENALGSYQECLPLLARVAGAAELAETGIDYATALHKLNRRAELRELAADLAGWLDQLKGHLKLRAAIENFKAVIELGQLDVERFREIQQEIRIAVAATRQRALKAGP